MVFDPPPLNHLQVAMRDFRNALTALGALLPGFIAFFGNCVRSNAEMTHTDTERWKREYAYGASHEVYVVDIDADMFSEPIFEV